MAPDDVVEAPIEQQTPAVEAPVTTEKPVESASEPRQEKTEKPKKQSVRETLLASVKEETEKADRARDEAGKFVKEAKSKEPKAAPETAAPKDTPAPTEKTAQPPASSPVSGAPKAWPKEKHAIWDGLSQEARDFLLTREDQVSNGFKQYEHLAPVKQFVERYTPAFTQMGVAPSQFMENAMSYHMAFMNPQTRDAAARDFLASYGIQIPSTSPHTPDPSDPVQNVAPLVQQYVHPLQQDISALKATITQQEQNRINSELATFAKAHPHFEKVRIQMGQLIQAGVVPPTDLEGAYNQAIWLNPEIREQMQKEEYERQDKLNREKAEAAKKANVSLTSRAPVAPQANGKDKPTSIRGTILSSIQEVREKQRA